KSTDDRGMYHVDVTPGDYIVGVLAATTTVPGESVRGFLQAQAEGGVTFDNYLRQITAQQGGVLPRGVGARIGPLHVSQFGDRNSPVVPPPTTDARGTWFYPSMYHPAGLSMSAA